jgi:lipoprotein-releasing system ATP-binding protein
MTDDRILISAKSVRKTYRAEASSSEKQGHGQQPSEGLEVLKGIDLDIFTGEALCIMGSSGAGKSTLLHILGALDKPTSGAVEFRSQNLSTMSDDKLSEFRNRSMSFVFQFHHLLNEFTALENVMMPALIGGETFSKAKSKAVDLLRDLGLQGRTHHRPNALSGGEQQRVAIARALVRNPAVIFADEPTGNLDQKNGQQVQSLLFDLQKRHGLTLVAVTHDYEFARRFPKVRNLRDGQWV